MSARDCFKTYSDKLQRLIGDTPLTRAEQRLIDNNGAVSFAETRPSAPTDDNTSRPELIRHLAEAGCDDATLSHHGLAISGAWVTGDLNLRGLHHDISFILADSHIKGQVHLHDAELKRVHLNGTFCNGLQGQRCKLTTNLFLSNGFHAAGTVDLLNAAIGGQFACRGGSFSRVLCCQGTQVKSDWVYDGLAKPPKQLVATNMSVSNFSDDENSYRRTSLLHLEGFTFNRLTSNMSPAQRLAIWNRKYEDKIKPKIPNIPWLCHTSQRDFDPAPHSFLARYYDRAGHHSAARDIRVSRDRRVAQATYNRRICSSTSHEHEMRNIILGNIALLVSSINNLSLSFNHKPARSIGILLILGFIGWYVFSSAYAHDQMVPAQAPILASADWQRSIEQAPDNPAAHWKAHSNIGKDYETFNAVLYTADVIIPLVDFTQEAAWSPSHTRGNWGVAAFWAKPLLKFFGWVLSAVITAAFAGFIERKD